MKINLIVLFICCLSVTGLAQSKDSINLARTWQTVEDKDTLRLIFSGSSFRFNHTPENVLDKMDFLYELKNENGKYN